MNEREITHEVLKILIDALLCVSKANKPAINAGTLSGELAMLMHTYATGKHDPFIPIAALLPCKGAQDREGHEANDGAEQ